MKVINLNGPAMSGKDALAKEICLNLHGEEIGVHVEFKEMLIDIAIRTAGINRELWDALYHRDYKEVPQPYFIVAGKQVSARNWLIHISEDVVKPVFGESVFCDALSKKLVDIEQSLPDYNVTFVISDGGFPDEAVPVINAAKGNFNLIKLTRKNQETGEYLNFDGDSRRYLSPEDFDPSLKFNYFEVENVNGDLSGTARKIIKLTSKGE